MPIAPGARLGAYEIVALVGAGGMGEVYRARDTRLDRTVAIKVLPAQFAADPQLRERFDREARAISSLNHPHICALYDVGRSAVRSPEGLRHAPPDVAQGFSPAEVDFLVLEFLEGETLANRLMRTGTIPVEEALRVAAQVCDALDRAHRAGIVHRDLKPANIFLVRSSGASAPPVAKLLDFGLAKTAAPVVAASGLSMMPTTPPLDAARGGPLTAQGTILGTFQYMAPEQIEGVEADARTDIFAFGALLFEMLTGRTAFDGKTRASLLGAILKDEPPRVSTVQPLAPASLDRIVATCLAKDPDDRYQSARDLLRELKWIASSAASGPAPDTGPAKAGRHVPSGGPSRVAWAVAGVLGIALTVAGVVAMRHLHEAPPAADAIQFNIPPPPNAVFGGPVGVGTGTAAQIAVSPDGRHVVFAAGGQKGFQLWLRALDTTESRAMTGTEGAAFPFWSPDSRFIGFFATGKLQRVNIAGGPPIVLCDAPSGRGGAWNRNNVIVFAAGPAAALLRVSGAGGVPTAASVLDKTYGDTGHRWPHFLPDGRHFLFTAAIGACCPPIKPAVIRVGTLDSMEAATLFEAESSVEYASGHLLFWREGTLMAERFDPDVRQVRGEPFPVAEQVRREASRYASFSVSESGILAYAHGAPETNTRLTWFDREGRQLGTVGEPGSYFNPALSPDERRVAVSLATGTPTNRNIWLIDAERGTTSRFTFDPGPDTSPVWSPDGSRIAFRGIRGSEISLRQKLVTGAVNDEPMAAGNFTPTDWSADGRFVAYESFAGSSDIWVLPLFGDRKPFAFAHMPFTEANAVFSPDGRWIAYQSNETGSNQVYVQPFPATGGKYLVSRDSGTQPIWRRDGKELFFLAFGATMMAAVVDTTRQFDAGIPRPLFGNASTVTVSTFVGNGVQYAVSKDGKRFLVNTVQQQAATTPLTVVVNWQAALTARENR